MMFKSNFVAAIKVNGKVLREFGDEVFIPFGCEYSILLKNLNSVRAVVNVTIDGENVSPGGFVINANDSLNLERYVKDLNKGNRFKFIERSTKIEKHRGIKVEDGLIRIEYQFEKPYRPPADWFVDNFNLSLPHGSWGSGPIYGRIQPATGIRPTLRFGSTQGNLTVCNAVNSMSGTASAFCAQPGITVPGSESNQKFTTTYVSNLEYEKHVINFKLVGTGPETIISKPITVKQKSICKFCGTSNKISAKHCSECGASLNIIN